MRNQIRVESISFGAEGEGVQLRVLVRLWPKPKKNQAVPYDPTALCQAIRDFLTDQETEVPDHG